MLRVLTVNFLLLLFIAIAAELIFGNWIQTAYSWLNKTDGAWYFTDHYYASVYSQCPDPITHHNYCPNVSTRDTMSPEDGGFQNINFVNRSGLRVEGPEQMDSETDVASFDIINLGDSFMQARAIPFSRTLSFEMARRTGHKVLQVGMGSWAPIVEFGWLSQQELKPGVQVNLFIGLNDVTPHYAQSTLRYYSMGSLHTDGTLRFGSFGLPVAPELRHFIAMHSAIYRGLLKLRLLLMGQDAGDAADAAYAKTAERYSSVVGMPGDNLSDCSPLSQASYATPNTKDHIELALDKSCWSEETIREVEQAIKDIQKADAYVKKFNGRLTVLVVTTPWAFQGETLIGKQSPRYNMAESTLIGTQGFAKQLKLELASSNVSVIDLESVIRTMKVVDGEQFYFPRDGHWNNHAHEVLGSWMAQQSDTLPKRD